MKPEVTHAARVKAHSEVHKAPAALTAAAVRKFKPNGKRRVIRDYGARSLYLVISPSGAKSWLMRFRTPSGRIGKITLGPLHTADETSGAPVIGEPLTLAGARLLAADIHRRRQRNEDVIAERQAQKHRQRTELAESNAKTFAAAACAFIDEHAKPSTRRWYESARLLGLAPVGDDDFQVITGGLVQRWADKPVADIDQHDIWSVVDEARRVSIPGIKPRTPGLSKARPRALLAALSTMFGWLHENRKIERNPCAGLERPKAPPPRERVLTNDELRWFWQGCDKIGQPFGPIFKLLALTGQRLREVGGMHRDELDGDMWSIPGTRTKNKRLHKVPLSPLARQLIPESDGLIFSTTGDTLPSGWSRAKTRLDKAMLTIARSERAKPIDDWRLHDLRRTAVTGMAELGIRPDVIELTVNHQSGSRGGIAGVYNRSELMPERKAALERWAAHVEGLVSGKKAKVVNMSKRRGKAS